MGCIVNGPGEMADADFGYVGGAPGKINLYKNKVCVEKNIPQERSIERLVELIKKKVVGLNQTESKLPQILKICKRRIGGKSPP